MDNSFSAALRKRPLDIPKGGAFFKRSGERKPSACSIHEILSPLRYESGKAERMLRRRQKIYPAVQPSLIKGLKIFFSLFSSIQIEIGHGKDTKNKRPRQKLSEPSERFQNIQKHFPNI